MQITKPSISEGLFMFLLLLFRRSQSRHSWDPVAGQISYLRPSRFTECANTS